jgi:hypothetical protein
VRQESASMYRRLVLIASTARVWYLCRSARVSVGIVLLHLYQQFGVMYYFPQILNTVLGFPPCDVFDNIAFAKTQSVFVDVLDGLDGHVFVMRTANLLI